MSSYTLRNQRDSFVTSCSSYLEAHSSMLVKIQEIERTLSTSSDTLLVEYLHDVNSKLVKRLNSLDTFLVSSRDKTVVVVNKKISELEEAERQAANNTTK